MLLIVGLAVALIAIVVIPRVRAVRGVNAPNLGYMSQHWLAEHRASHAR